jgi:Tfp pilus assembly protein PilO
MNKQLLIKKLLSKKEIKDYTNMILFFLISSFFIVFAIKPALIVAFSRKREAFDLKRINTIYEKNILKIVETQARLENIRDKTYLLHQALPKNPEMKILIDDIKKIANSESMLINNLRLASVDLKKKLKENKRKPLIIEIETEGEFPNLKNFIQKMVDQRRIKIIKNLRVLREDNLTTASARLKIMMKIEGYYL